MICYKITLVLSDRNDLSHFYTAQAGVSNGYGVEALSVRRLVEAGLLFSQAGMSEGTHNYPPLLVPFWTELVGALQAGELKDPPTWTAATQDEKDVWNERVNRLNMPQYLLLT